MQEQVINISFPVNANILLSLKESKDEFIRDILFFTALLFYRKGKLTKFLRMPRAFDDNRL